MPVRLLQRASLILVLAAAAASGADKPDQGDTRYQAERATCACLQDPGERTSCLREAAAARSAARQGKLDNQPGAGPQDFERNALARCDALPVSDRELCIRRTRGEGTVNGSVQEGGIYREYREIILPDATPQAEPPAPAGVR